MPVLKVSNASEHPAVLDMEAAAGLRVTAVDPGCASRCRGGRPRRLTRNRHGRATTRRAPRGVAGRRARALGAAVRRAARQQPHRRRGAVRPRSSPKARRRRGWRRRCAGSRTRVRTARWCGTSSTRRPRARCAATSAMTTPEPSWRACSTRHAGLAAAADAGTYTDLTVDNALSRWTSRTCPHARDRAHRDAPRRPPGEGRLRHRPRLSPAGAPCRAAGRSRRRSREGGRSAAGPSAPRPARSPRGRSPRSRRA